MTKEERLAKAREAQAEKRRQRAEANSRALASLVRHMVGTTPLPTQPPQKSLSSTDRARRFRARGREIGEIPRCRHRRVRERFRFDLLGFGLTYGMEKFEAMKKPLLKRRPSPRMVRFVRQLQDKILHGGLKHVRWPRGKGKTTWVKIAIIWAALYGHKFFMVVVEKTKGMAQVVVDEIWNRIHLSPRLSADFPEFAVPMHDVMLSPQRIRVQTCNGKPTYMKQDVSKFHYYKLPTVDGYPNTGAIIAWRGADQALRGINIDSARPDFFFIDDPQTEEDARNPKTVAKIEKEITSAVLGSGELSERISAVMASTAIEPNDVSETFADPQKHPEWETETERLVVTFGPKAEMSAYLKMMSVDIHAAHAYYLEHQAEIEKGVEMMDDGDFNPLTEASAYEHALYLLFTMKATSFYAEMQMIPSKAQGIYKITPKRVRERVNGVPFGVVPLACDQGLLAFVDVNADAGLRWEVAAFGAGRRVATLAYGQYPAEGQRLYPEGIPESAIPGYLGPALREVAERIMRTPFHDEDGNPRKVGGICFDGGWQTATVATKVDELNADGIVAAWSKGFSSKEYSRNHHERAAAEQEEKAKKGKRSPIKAAEECHTWRSNTFNSIFLAFNSDYWKEVSQTSYLAEPLAPSSSSFYGDDPNVHIDFAQEVCNEELQAKERSTRCGSIWTWKKSKGLPNHFGDVHAGVMAYGAIRAFFDPIASVAGGDGAGKHLAARKKRRRFVYEG